MRRRSATEGASAARGSRSPGGPGVPAVSGRDEGQLDRAREEQARRTGGCDVRKTTGTGRKPTSRRETGGPRKSTSRRETGGPRAPGRPEQRPARVERREGAALQAGAADWSSGGRHDGIEHELRRAKRNPRALIPC